MKKLFSLFFILSSAVAFGQVESYQTTIYTSDELAAEIQTVVDDNNSRGLGLDMFAAGANLGVDPGLTGTAIAWGDAWTNLIQPFWAIPALAIAKLNAKDIMGFCIIDLIVSGLIICGGLLIWAI